MPNRKEDGLLEARVFGINEAKKRPSAEYIAHVMEFCHWLDRIFGDLQLVPEATAVGRQKRKGSWDHPRPMPET